MYSVTSEKIQSELYTYKLTIRDPQTMDCQLRTLEKRAEHL